jgi:hypothetical protein
VIANLPREPSVSRNFWVQEKLDRINRALHQLFFHIVILLPRSVMLDQDSPVGL